MGVYAVIWQAGTNWAGPVRIQIYYGLEFFFQIFPNFYKQFYVATSKLQTFSYISDTTHSLAQFLLLTLQEQDLG